MALTNDQITAQNFKDFYGQIRPYLNGSFPTPIVNAFARGDLYSTDEKIIGCWTDGKPLYQKTLLYEEQTAANTETTLFTLGEDFDHLVSLEAIAGYMVGGSTTNLNYLSVPYDETNNCFVRVYASSQGKTIKMRTSGFSFGFKNIYVTIRYTKTGDSAIKVGTGTDYSTDEQVIGTWIDGKPLYQRVFVQSGTISTRTRYFESAFLAANIDNIVERTTNVAISYDGGSSIRGIYWASNNDYFQCLVEKNGAYPVFSGSGITFSDLTVIVSYTKTTD